MGQLLVRDLDDEVIRRIKQRAAANGRSTEAEHRAILEAAVRISNDHLVERARQLWHAITDGGPDSADMSQFRDRRTARS
jgi:plasmid stability protein